MTGPRFEQTEFDVQVLLGERSTRKEMIGTDMEFAASTPLCHGDDSQGTCPMDS